jgi:autotransporter adhesin
MTQETNDPSRPQQTGGRPDAPNRLRAPTPTRLAVMLLACLSLPTFAIATETTADARPGTGPTATTLDPAAKTGTEEEAALAKETATEADDELEAESLESAERYFSSVGDPAGGDDALAVGEFSTAIGSSSFALGAESIAIGHLATSIGDFSTAIGYGVSSGGTSAVAIGGYAVLPEYNAGDAPMLEMVTSANGENATAIGPGATANGLASLALGAGAEATGDIATAIGLRAQATGGFSTAIGPWSVADGLGATAMGVASKAIGRDATAVGAGAFADGIDATAFGEGSYANQSGVAVGPVARAEGMVSTAVGPGSTSVGELSVAVGAASQAYGWRSVATGFHSVARGDGTVAVGDYASTGGYLPQAPGEDPGGPCWICPPEEGGPTAQDVPMPREARGAVAMGQFAQAYTDNSLALGSYTLVSGENSVAIGSGSHADRDNVVSVGASEKWYGNGEDNLWRDPIQRQVINVAAGTEDHDAVNVAQLGQFAPVLGGGAALVDGVLTRPSYSIAGQTYSDVGSAFTAVDGRLAALQDAIDGIPTDPDPPGPGPGDPGDPGEPGGIGYDDEDKRTVTLEGEGGTRVRNVADGTAPDDAVNKGQMDAGDAATLTSSRRYTDTVAVQTLSSAKSYTDQRFDVLSDQFEALEDHVGRRLEQQDKRIDKIGAMSSAMMSMSINAANSRSPRGRIAVGAGWQGGESALSVGYAKSIGRASFSLGGAFTNDESSAGVGFGIDL